ncbi:MAG: phosphotransferase [Verrucomicrobiota bacterium]
MSTSNFPTLLAATRRAFSLEEGAALQLEPILKGGSDRAYYRITGVQPCILSVYGTERQENESFAPLTHFLAERVGVPVPQILAQDLKARRLWLQDLGETDLYALAQSQSEDRLKACASALTHVARLHRFPLAQTDDLGSHVQLAFDNLLYQWEQDYFFNEFVIPFSQLKEESIASLREHPELARLRDDLAALPRCLVHRDFQSHNLIWHQGQTWFIDYQGLRPGRGEYDLASFLYDPYVDFTENERSQLLAVYQEALAQEVNPSLLRDCALQRLMQALGAYGYLSLKKGKTAFLEHIPPALERLRLVLAESPLSSTPLGTLRFETLRHEPFRSSA